MRIFEIKPFYCDEMPLEFAEGILYICEKYKTASHLCACGCMGIVTTPLIPGEWTLTKNNNSVTLRPSIGNWKGQKPYHAHYLITNNKIEWVE